MNQQAGQTEQLPPRPLPFAQRLENSVELLTNAMTSFDGAQKELETQKGSVAAAEAKLAKAREGATTAKGKVGTAKTEINDSIDGLVQVLNDFKATLA